MYCSRNDMHPFCSLLGGSPAATAAAAAELKSAAVRAGAAGPPYRHAAAAGAVHNLADGSGATEYVCHSASVGSALLTFWLCISHLLRSCLPYRYSASPESANATTSKPRQSTAGSDKYRHQHSGPRLPVDIRLFVEPSEMFLNGNITSLALLCSQRHLHAQSQLRLCRRSTT